MLRRHHGIQHGSCRCRLGNRGCRVIEYNPLPTRQTYTTYPLRCPAHLTRSYWSALPRSANSLCRVAGASHTKPHTDQPEASADPPSDSAYYSI